MLFDYFIVKFFLLGDDKYINIYCFGNGMIIYLIKKFFLSFNYSFFYLNNNLCIGYQFNYSYIILEIGFSDCGIIKRRFKGLYFYVNLV